MNSNRLNHTGCSKILLKLTATFSLCHSNPLNARYETQHNLALEFLSEFCIHNVMTCVYTLKFIHQ